MLLNFSLLFSYCLLSQAGGGGGVSPKNPEGQKENYFSRGNGGKLIMKMF